MARSAAAQSDRRHLLQPVRQAEETLTRNLRASAKLGGLPVHFAQARLFVQTTGATSAAVVLGEAGAFLAGRRPTSDARAAGGHPSAGAGSGCGCGWQLAATGRVPQRAEKPSTTDALLLRSRLHLWLVKVQLHHVVFAACKHQVNDR